MTTAPQFVERWDAGIFDLVAHEHTLVSGSDSAGRILFANARFCARTGYSFAELRGQSYRIVGSDRHPPAFFEELWSTIGAGRTWRGELCNQTKTREFFWVDTTILPLVDSSGSRRYAAIQTEITRYKHAEQAAREVDDLLSATLQLSPEAIVILDLADGRVVRANAAFWDRWGGPDGADPGHPLDRYLDWERAGEQRALVARLQGGAAVTAHEAPARTAGGKSLLLRIGARQVSMGAQSCLLLVLQDITGRHEAEAGAARLAAIVESSSDAIVGKDLDGVVTSWNGAAAAIFGYAAAEMVGQPITRLIPRARLGEEAEILARIRRGERVLPFDTVRLHRDGRPIDVSVAVSAIRGPAGNIVGASKVARDITARKRAEDEIRQLNTRLEERVHARTAELLALNRELETFSYSVSHDLRAPLRGIDGFTQAILEDFGDLLPEEGRGHLGRIRACARRMGNLIDDLLMLARLSQHELNRVRVDCDALVRGAFREIEAAEITPDPVALRLNPLPACFADPTLLQQVWINLISNARKFSARQAQPVVEIGGAPSADGVTYWVKDNGVGFNMLYAQKLFGVFQRLHSAEEYEGTGIGLATVRRIVERHRGRVWADSSPGRGATFFFFLPA